MGKIYRPCDHGVGGLAQGSVADEELAELGGRAELALDVGRGAEDFLFVVGGVGAANASEVLVAELKGDDADKSGTGVREGDEDGRGGVGLERQTAAMHWDALLVVGPGAVDG